MTARIGARPLLRLQATTNNIAHYRGGARSHRQPGNSGYLRPHQRRCAHPRLRLLAHRIHGSPAPRGGRMLDRGVWPVRAHVRPDVADTAGQSRKRGCMSKHPSPQETEWPEDAIFNLWHSTLPIDRFLALLHTYGITCLADIRTVPRPRHNPQCSGDALADALKPENIEYAPLPLARARRFTASAQKLSEHRLAQRRLSVTPITCRPRRFEEGLATLVHVSRQRRVAVMCAEAVPWPCHRSVVADALSVRGIPAVEILSESSYRLHKLTPFARVKGTQITYRSGQSALLL
jgi:hypothetical protein